MSKIFTFILSVLISGVMLGQNNRSSNLSVTENINNLSNESLLAKSNMLQCDTLYNFNIASASTTVGIYTPGTGGLCTTGGYVTGNNCYGDIEKATYQSSNYNALLSPSVTGCYVFFYRNSSINKGTKGVLSHTVGVKIYSGNMSTGPGVVSLGQTSSSIGSILGVFSSTTTIGYYTFNFSNAVPLSGAGFFTSVVLPNTVGDTAVIFAQIGATSTSGWERQNDNAWYEMKTSWGGTINFQMCMFPILGCSGFAGIKESDLDNFIKIVPNPNNGVFHVISTVQNLDFELEVTNTLGQSLQKHKLMEGENNLEINLNRYGKGIYFLNFTHNGVKSSKRVVVE